MFLWFIFNIIFINANHSLGFLGLNFIDLFQFWKTLCYHIILIIFHLLYKDKNQECKMFVSKVFTILIKWKYIQMGHEDTDKYNN